MAKRARKQRTEAERAEIEADRVAAHGEPILGSNVQVGEFPELPEAIAEMVEEGGKAGDAPEAEGQPFEEFLGDGEGDAVEIEEVKEPNSIVKDKFKVKYIENAKAMGATSKAAKRSNWDWLSQQLAAACLSDKGKIEIGAFTDILEANGVDHSRWTNKNKGWEGRFRMTGRVALQKVVANAGKLVTPGGTEIEAPTEFIAKYKTKA